VKRLVAHALTRLAGRGLFACATPMGGIDPFVPAFASSYRPSHRPGQEENQDRNACPGAEAYA